MSGYNPDDFRNETLVERYRRARAECGRVTDMPRDVGSLGGGMIRARSAARHSASPMEPPAQPDIVAMEARLTALINSNGSGQGWVILTQVLCTAAIIGAVIAMKVIA